jgi:tRNA (guanine37-N1)-methyltransferase
MVIQALPVIKAIEKAKSNCSLIRANRRIVEKVKIIWLSPGGKQFETGTAKKLVKFKHLIIICGRYEGIDARVKKAFKVEEISIGPYVLTGGELPAMAIIDSVSRQVEGVLGNFDSREEERVSSSDVYTRPEVLEYKGKKLRVPKVLLSGHRAKIEEWKKKGV